MKREIVITYEGSKADMQTEGANAGDMIIMLTEALRATCDAMGVPYERAMTIAYAMEEKGELWKEVER